MTEVDLGTLIIILGGMLAPVYTLLIWLLKVVGCHGERIAVQETETEHHDHNHNNNDKKHCK